MGQQAALVMAPAVARKLFSARAQARCFGQQTVCRRHQRGPRSRVIGLGRHRVDGHRQAALELDVAAAQRGLQDVDHRVAHPAPAVGSGEVQGRVQQQPAAAVAVLGVTVVGEDTEVARQRGAALGRVEHGMGNQVRAVLRGQVLGRWPRRDRRA